jgi:hypothetical protein
MAWDVNSKACSGFGGQMAGTCGRRQRSLENPTTGKEQEPMQPIEIKIHGFIPKTSIEICTLFQETERWSEFKGYSILPGVKSAAFISRTPQMLGSRIQVHNTDGTSHTEEIIEWDVQRRVVLRMQDFGAPLKHLATHFIETWEFSPVPGGTDATRAMRFYPTGLPGWLALLPISRLMKKAFEANLRESQGQ